MADNLRAFGSLYEEQTRNGLTRPKAVRGTGVKMVNMGELFAHPRIKNVRMDRVALDGNEATRFLLKPDDLLFARQSLVLEGAGKCSIFLTDEELVTFESHVTRARLNKDEADPLYYYYYFQSPHGQSAIRGIVEQGAGASGIRGRDLEKLQVLWRPISEQRAISRILGALDDKIEQNRRTAQALERLARAIFRAWFVDFEPVKAKAAGATSFPSMLQSVFDMMPTRLDDSEIGPIPAAWEVKSLADACTFVSGGTPKRSEPLFWNGQIPWYSVRDSPDCGAWVTDTEERITSFGIANSAARIVPAGCTIISARGTVGKLAMAGVPMAFNQSCYGLLPKDGEAFTYLYLLLQSVVANLQQRAHGSVFETITLSTFDQLKIISPSPGIVKLFEMVVSPYFGLSKALLQESVSLNKIRDYLLPLLLSGRVSVTSTNAGE